MRGPTLAVALLAAAVSTGGCLDDLLGGGGGPRDYLSADTYGKWVIEVDTVEGMGPPSGALEFLRGKLAGVVNKPDGIEIVNDETLPQRNGAWSDQDIRDFSASHRDRRTSGGTVTTHLLFVDGNSVHDDSNGRVLGVAIGHETIVLFTESIRGACQPLAVPPCTDSRPIWRSVLVHEFGHAMGLVDNGIPMVNPHEDPGHPGHSSNQDSVMYWQVENSGIFNFFAGDPPTDFDQNDRADLCKAGGQC